MFCRPAFAGTIFFLSWGARGLIRHRRLQRVAGKRRLGSVTHENWLALLNRDGKLDLDVVVIDSTMVPPRRRRRHGPQPDGPCQIRHQTHAAGGQQRRAAGLAHDGSQRQRPTATGNHHSQVSSHPGQTGTPQRTPRGRLGGSRLADSEANPLCCCVGWESNRSSPSVALEHGWFLVCGKFSMGSGTHQMPGLLRASNACASAGTACPSFNTLERSRHEHHLLSPLSESSH